MTYAICYLSDAILSVMVRHIFHLSLFPGHESDKVAKGVASSRAIVPSPSVRSPRSVPELVWVSAEKIGGSSIRQSQSRYIALCFGTANSVTNGDGIFFMPSVVTANGERFRGCKDGKRG